ncbi:fasciclin domain-containing protein [Planctomycetota bacterium]
MTRFPRWNATLASVVLVVASASSQSFAKDIVDTAVGAGSFKTLAAALQAADLVDALKSKGPFTVLAPTDEAFAKLPAGTVESLLKPENKSKLIAILKYHVVAGRVYSTDALAAGKATTLQGDTGGCAKVYMTTAKNILAMENHGMCSSTAHTLRTALNSSAHSNCSETQACTMRRALDVAYNNVR